MTRPWTRLDSVDTPEGLLELRQRGERDFMITVGGRVLMTSMIHRSEVAVAQLGCEPIRARPSPRVLIGGLGLGFTLRAALDTLPPTAHVVIAELNPTVVKWCNGPCSALSRDALSDPRVEVAGDVTQPIRDTAADAKLRRFDAIILDLYEGPRDGKHAARDPLYGSALLKQTYRALSSGGIYAVWGENPAHSFEDRARKVGFEIRLVRPKGGGGPRHAVYVAKKR